MGGASEGGVVQLVGIEGKTSGHLNAGAKSRSVTGLKEEERELTEGPGCNLIIQAYSNEQRSTNLYGGLTEDEETCGVNLCLDKGGGIQIAIF